MAVKYVGRAVDYLLGGPTVGGADEVRLRHWLALPAADLMLPHARARYVVVDTHGGEFAGRPDPLGAIGAIAVARMEIDLDECFSAAMPQDAAGRGGNDALHAGIHPACAMLDFLDYLGRSPLVAFEVTVQQRTVERAVKSILGVPFRHPWIDLAALLRALFPGAECATFDDWLANFGLGGAPQRDAIVDAFAAAQLLQIALVAADRVAMSGASDLIAMQEAQARPVKR